MFLLDSFKPPDEFNIKLYIFTHFVKAWQGFNR